jgi:molybdenum cofactor guanylyltransferase
MAANDTLIGAILIGGRSSRMGSPKAAVTMPDGRSMTQWVHDAVAAVCSRVVLVGAAAAPADASVNATPPAAPTPPAPSTPPGLADLPVIRDQRPQRGPLAGIEALLSSGLGDHYLIVPCDLPLLTADVLGPLLEPPEAEPEAMATMFANHPLPMRISAACAAAITEVLDGPGPYSINHAARAVDARAIPLPDAVRTALMNVNTPDDLAAARAIPRRSST